MSRVILVHNKDNNKKIEDNFETNPKEMLILSDVSKDIKETSNKYIGKDKYFTLSQLGQSQYFQSVLPDDVIKREINCIQ